MSGLFDDFRDKARDEKALRGSRLRSEANRTRRDQSATKSTTNQTVNLTLPYPVSVNSLYKPVRYGKGARFVRTTEAVRYKIQAKRAAGKQTGGLKPLAKRLKVLIVAFMPDGKKRDLDNLFKIALDALNGVVWIDDEQIDDLHVIRGGIDTENPRIELVISEMGKS